MSATASQITSVSIVCSTVCSGSDQRNHQSSASLAFMRRIHRWLMNSPHKGPVTRKMFPYDDVIMQIHFICKSLHWRHNDHDGMSNHQPHGCLLNLLFRRWSKKTSKLLVTGLCVGNSPGPVNSPHKGPVTRKMFPFDDVIMIPRAKPAGLCEKPQDQDLSDDRQHYFNWGYIALKQQVLPELMLTQNYVANSQTTFSNAFSLTKMDQFRLRLHWRLSPKLDLTIFPDWFR